ncbi:hypothetical protein vseg_021505 [Gypsophila vaccaria]
MKFKSSSVIREEPCLVYEQQGRNHIRFPFAPVKNTAIPHLSRHIIVASYYGWLVVSDYDDHACLSLFHPFSRAFIDLPRLDLFSEDINPRDNFLRFFLTCEPNEHNLDTGSCLLMISHKGLLLCCRVGFDDTWHTHCFEVVVEGVSRPMTVIELAVFKGVIYGIVMAQEMVLLRIRVSSYNSDSKLAVTVESVARSYTEKFANYQSPYLDVRLVEFDDCLACVLVFVGDSVHTNVQDVRVIKFVLRTQDNDKTSKDTYTSIDEHALDFIEVENLGNRAIFGGWNCSFVCDIPSTGREEISFGSTESLLVQNNCVYLLFDTRAIYVYRLHDRSLATAHIFPNVEMSCDRVLWVRSATKKRYHDEDCENKGSRSEKSIAENLAEKQLSELPSELVRMVAKCLALSDYSNFRVTCKECREAAPPLPSWLDRRSKIEFLEATKSKTVLPWLLFLSNDGKLCNIIDPTHTNDRYLITIPRGDSYKGMDAFYSKDGLLFIFGEDGNMFFYNPFTKAKTDTKRPTRQLKGYLQSVGCSSLPNSQGCTIVGLCSTQERLLIGSYVYGDDSWHNFAATGAGDTLFVAADNSPVFYKNAFYFLDVTGRLATYRVMPNGSRKCEVMKKPTRPPCISSSAHMSTYLVECHRHLLSVFVGYTDGWVKVFRLDFTRKRWVQVDNLENYMIFLSPRSSFAKLAPINRPEYRNKIYLPKLHRDGLACYDFLSHRYCSMVGSREGDSIEDLSQVREILRCVWIEPRWS